MYTTNDMDIILRMEVLVNICALKTPQLAQIKFHETMKASILTEGDQKAPKSCPTRI